MALLINPPASKLGMENAILWGRGRRQYHVRDFPGPLSIKAMIRGTAEWRTGDSRFELDSNSFLILNHHQPYSITVDSKEPVETFCVFFARGFVEDAWRASTAPESELLDDPMAQVEVGFFETLRARGGPIGGLLDQMRREPDEDQIYRLALALLRVREELTREIARIPAARASTREELHRRLHRGKQCVDEMFAQPVSLADIAQQASLSPFHFHRAFTLAFGETPHAYRTRRRLETAARLLVETDLSVLEICLDTGFESPASFSTLFRKRFESSPRRFREFARSNKKSQVFYSRMLP